MERKIRGMRDAQSGPNFLPVRIEAIEVDFVVAVLASILPRTLEVAAVVQKHASVGLTVDVGQRSLSDDGRAITTQAVEVRAPDLLVPGIARAVVGAVEG